MTVYPSNSVDASVLVIGGGPVGLTLAALLARYGVKTTVVEADNSYCNGSRAICVSRRSQEIFGWIGADEALVRQGLPWVGGRSYYKNDEVLHFQMPSEASERFAPMINIQQHRIEAMAHEALQAQPAQSCVLWSTRLIALRQNDDGVEADVAGTRLAVAGAEVGVAGAHDQRQTLRARWLVACDGGRSTVREQLGLQLNGMQYDGRYVIVDIEQESQRPVERLAWFDPPSNPGSTLLMHRQPGNVWRIDYQIRDDEDPVEAVKPENVLPRVESHLQMIGETAPWKPLWISIYNAKCLTLDNYRHGRVLFAGDAAHLVPIFGVRGLNSGLDDAGNLAWKLASVLAGTDTDLLDSYSVERRHAALENMAYGAKSTEFMAPPNFAFKLLREATLRLAAIDPLVRSLINPRQSTPVAYVSSPLNCADCDVWTGAAAPGTPAPEALLQRQGQPWHLSRAFGQGFTLLYFTLLADVPAELLELQSKRAAGLQLCIVTREATCKVAISGAQCLADLAGEAWNRFDAREGTLYVIRPDGYVLGRWREPDCNELRVLLARFQTSSKENER